MEQFFGKGAIVTPTIRKMPTLPRSSVPFDWTTTFSTRELVTKDQNGSGSCGGQAVSYKGEADTGIQKSARFPYSQIYAPGSGSSEQGLLKIIVTEGLCDESVFTSYDNGNPPSEIFMENTSDITPFVLSNAQKFQGVPVYVDLSIDGIAEAVRDNNGIIIGIAGQNNGSWSSNNPLPPTGNGNPFWYHWLFVGKVGMFNGKKAMCVKNSWGNNVGDNGWQWLTEDYLPYLFSAWTFVKGNGYKFNSNLYIGKNGEDVFALQARLGIVPTGYFGPKTFAAVVSYQRAHSITPTGFCGPITRRMLNIG